MSQQVIIVGAGGFIGRSLVAEFSKFEEYDILQVFRSTYEVSGVSYNYNNICEVPLLPRAIVYFVAWGGTVGVEARSDHNVQISNVTTLMDWYLHAKAKESFRFIYTGSIYEIETLPDLFYPANDFAYKPTNVYGAAKIAAAVMLSSIASKDLPLIIVRIGNIVGVGGDDKRLLNWLIQSALNENEIKLSSGEQLYDFLHISDAQRALRLLGINVLSSNIYNLSSGKPKKLKLYLMEALRLLNYENIEDCFQRNIHIPDRLTPAVFDTSCLRKDTGFVPNMSFKDSVKELIKYYST